MTEAITMGQLYNDLVTHVRKEGRHSSPRGLSTRETIGDMILIATGEVIMRKNMNTKLAILEGLMMVGGIFELGLISVVAPKAKLSLFHHQSEYGPRIKNQVPKILDILKHDPYSRRAVLFLNDRDGAEEDMACTTSIQFITRDGIMYTLVTLRSWDLVYGFPNDIVMYGMLSKVIANFLGCDAGPTQITAGSMHLYANTESLAEADVMHHYDIDLGDWPESDDWEVHRQHAINLCYAMKKGIDVPVSIISRHVHQG